MEFDIKKSRFSVKSRFKESKHAGGGHSLNRDFTIYWFMGSFCKQKYVHVLKALWYILLVRAAFFRPT